MSIQRQTVEGPGEQTRSMKMGLRWYGVALSLLVTWIVSMMDKVTVGIFIADKSFLRAVGLLGRPGMAGMLATAFLIAYGVAIFFWGFIIDKIGARVSLMISTIVWGVLEIAQGFSHSSGEIITMRIIMGAFEACIWPASVALTAKWFPHRERARANSIWLNGINIGPAFGVFFITLLVAQHGWRSGFIIAGILQLVVSTGMLLLLTAETPDKYKRLSAQERSYIAELKALDAKAEEKTRGVNRSIFNVLSDYKWWLVLIVWTLDTVIYFTIATWYASYMTQVHHLSLKSAGLLNSLSFVVAIVFMLIAGAVSDRILRRAPVSTAGYVLAAICLLIGIHSASAVTAVIWFALTLAFKNGGSAATSTLFHNNGPDMSIGGATGLQLGPSNIISAFGPYVFGIVIALSGGFATGFYGIVGLFAICAILSLVLALKGQ